VAAKCRLAYLAVRAGPTERTASSTLNRARRSCGERLVPKPTPRQPGEAGLVKRDKPPPYRRDCRDRVRLHTWEIPERTFRSPVWRGLVPILGVIGYSGRSPAAHMHVHSGCFGRPGAVAPGHST
jgi:hypothetical protein